MKKSYVVVYLAAVLAFAACGNDGPAKVTPNNVNNTSSDAGSDSETTTDTGTDSTSNDLGESCDDGILNQSETDVDCGGTCEPCADGDACLADVDCESSFCDDTGVCAVSLLELGAVCLNGADCESGQCEPFGDQSNCTTSCTDTCDGQNLACFRDLCTPSDFCDDPDGDGFGEGPGCIGSVCDRCDTDATCVEQNGGAFACICNDGWEGDGEACNDIDECGLGTNNCDANAVCSNTPGSFDCTCSSGFSGDGVVCADIDECADGTDNCDPLSACTNAVGSFSCGACPAGYDDVNGDGTVCNDIDECAIAGTCSDDADCTNEPGTFSCTCKPGFTGDGTTCTDIDECDLDLDNCDPQGGVCFNQDGGFSCACGNGYTGNGVTCTDIDECALGTDTCAPQGSICENQPPGSFSCSCDSGYVGNGFTCTNVDECADNSDNCDVNATCADTPGSFTCTCAAGYVGNGVTCTKIGDTCGTAIQIPSVPFTISGDTTGSTNDYQYNDNVCPGGDFGEGEGSEDDVYSFTPAVTANYALQLEADFDAAIYVASDCANIDGTCAGAAEVESSTPEIEIVSVALTAGTTYFIIVDGGLSFGDRGTYTLTIEADECANGTDNCGTNAACEKHSQDLYVPAQMGLRLTPTEIASISTNVLTRLTIAT